MEQALIKQAKKKGWWGKERGDRYVYGTMAKLKKKRVIK